MMYHQFQLQNFVRIVGIIGLSLGCAAQTSYAGPRELPAPTVENAAPNFYDRTYIELATADSQPTLKGIAPPNSTIRLSLPWEQQQKITTIANTEGIWQVQLPKIIKAGKYNIYIEAEVLESAKRTEVTALILVVDRTLPSFEVEALVDNNQLNLRNNPLVNTGSRFVGHADGTGSGMKELLYQIGDQAAIAIPISDNGFFNISFDIKNLAPGSHPVKFIVTDQAGNQKIFDTYKLQVSDKSKTIRSSNSAPISLRLLKDTGESLTDSWTSRPEIIIDILSGSKIKKLEARLLPASLEQKNSNITLKRASEQPHLKFQEITSWLNLNNMSLVLGEKTMTALDYAQLPSGAYTLEVKGDFENGKPFAENISFVLDRRAPTLVLSNIDGVTWDWEDHLLGVLQDDLGPIKIDYKLVETASSKAISRGTWQVPPGRVDILMPELVKTNKKIEEQTGYNLHLTVRDLAGNQDTLVYRVLILSTKELTDEDLLDSSKPTYR
jgi:hypothetical protein